MEVGERLGEGERVRMRHSSVSPRRRGVHRTPYAVRQLRSPYALGVGQKGGYRRMMGTEIQLGSDRRW